MYRSGCVANLTRRAKSELNFQATNGGRSRVWTALEDQIRTLEIEFSNDFFGNVRVDRGVAPEKILP